MAVSARDFSFKGAHVEVGTFSVNPASIAAGAQGTVALTVTGAKTGDLVFVSAPDLEADLVPAGAKVTAADTVTVYINNPGAGAVDGAAKTWSYMLVKLS